MTPLFDKNLQYMPLALRLKYEAESFYKEIFKRFVELGCSPYEISHILRQPIDFFAAQNVLYLRQNGKLPPGYSIDSPEYKENDRLHLVAQESSPEEKTKRELHQAQENKKSKFKK